MTTMVQLCGYKVLLINLLYTCQINGPSTLKLNFHGYTYSSDTDDTTVAKSFEESKNTLYLNSTISKISLLLLFT